ncbi:hypothetical protein PHMEG_0001257 [Phytophthora megakarya]|uniref:Uncharacterized protein n=1 Tax=Phytophthora megakarya TaxID=4795 RepID=A0A225X3K6_9STRA|nr:hypothetical protein PHMEG_0001257 [Phytophthora megakarya]
MGNQTNNRLESSWQKLKTLVNRSTLSLKASFTLDEVKPSIFRMQTGRPVASLEYEPSNRTRFNELLSIGRQVADIGASWGTEAHAKLKLELTKILDAVQSGDDQSSNSLRRNLVTLSADTAEERLTGTQLETSAQSETVHEQVEHRPSAVDVHHDVVDLRMSPASCAVGELVNDLGDSSFDLEQRFVDVSDADTETHSLNVAQSNADAQPKTVQA